MAKLLGMFLIIAGVSGVASAAFVAPEIDPASGATAVTLLAGAILVMRGRRRR